uniref:COMM domain-containing protein 9 n=1 Tax=Phallusia mammillata TaxID=59560 RepID=A0A6F9DAF2_9ASCI|nr:COMM domain-containing protein 9 [Phallusia mammillata]
MGYTADIHQYSGLLHLLKASSKKTVIEICRMVAQADSKADILTRIRTDLNLNDTEAEDLYVDLTTFVEHVTYHDFHDVDSIKSSLPADFHPNLRDLLTKIVADNSAKWRSDLLSKQVSFPKVEELNWKVESNSTTTGRPTCKLNIKTNDEKDIKIVMSKATLDTMLDSLSTIRDQISSVTP